MQQPIGSTHLSNALNCLNVGICILDENLRIAFVNPHFIEILGLDAKHCSPGARYADLLQRLIDCGEINDEEHNYIHKAINPARDLRQSKWTRIRPNGMVINISGRPLVNGGYAYAITDITEEVRKSERLHVANRAMIFALASLAEYRDTDTSDHVLRVARLSHEIARAMLRNGACDRSIADSIGLASVLHDVGKVGIADKILHKPGTLSCDERDAIQQHTTIGWEILRKIMALSPDSIYMQIAGEVAVGHHEWFNGEGYPTGAMMEDIPLSARIVAVADVFDALTSWRAYKDAWLPEQAIGYIRSLSGLQFDPAVIDAFITVMSNWSSTPALKWSEDFSTGYADIDRDHKMLIGMINQLAIPENREDVTVLEFTLDELSLYVSYHFSREEKLMESLEYTDLDNHRAVHKAFIDELEETNSSFKLKRQDLGDRVLLYLRDWLRDHILHVDKISFGKSEFCITQAAIGSSGANAESDQIQTR
jgi:hemerythrin-like metal-binding protein